MKCKWHLFDWRAIRHLPLAEKTQLTLGVLFVQSFQSMPNVANEISRSMKVMNGPINRLRKAVDVSFDTQWPHREIR
jgi:hypothetical protein